MRRHRSVQQQARLREHRHDLVRDDACFQAGKPPRATVKPVLVEVPGAGEPGSLHSAGLTGLQRPVRIPLPGGDQGIRMAWEIQLRLL